MNTDAGRKDPRLVAKLMDLVESGVNPLDIAKTLADEAELAALEELEGPPDEETFAREIKIIAQALAYRKAEPADLQEIMALLNNAYKAEVEGLEAFREGPSLNVELFIELFEDATYQWLVCEAPSGRGVEKDGVILGVCIFSVDGVSRCNGMVEGKLGSIRLFGVLPRFHGVCIGLRLLQKTEQVMFKAGCVRSMACTSSTRKRVATWLARRGYRLAGTSPYPAEAMGHVLLSQFRSEKESESETAAPPAPAAPAAPAAAPAPAPAVIGLMQFLKTLESSEATRPPAIADSKTSQAATTHTVLNLVSAQERQAEDELDEETDADKRKRLGMPHVEGKMHLPPHWRHAAPTPAPAPAPVPAPGDAAPVMSSAAEGVSGLDAAGKPDPEGEEQLPLD